MTPRRPSSPRLLPSPAAPRYLPGAMNLRLLWDDVRELPVFIGMAGALRRATDDSRETFGVLVREQAERIPDRVLLRFEEETVTYGAFNALTNAFAGVFKQAGVGREPVALMMENSPTLRPGPPRNCVCSSRE